MSDNKTWVKAQIEYTKSHCTNERAAGNRGTASVGTRGTASVGTRGAASVGEFGTASVGTRGTASVGEFGAASVGEFGAATAGYCGAATSRGKSSVGKNGIACSRSENARVKGGMGLFWFALRKTNMIVVLKPGLLVLLMG